MRIDFNAGFGPVAALRAGASPAFPPRRAAAVAQAPERGEFGLRIITDARGREAVVGYDGGMPIPGSRFPVPPSETPRSAPRP